MKLAIDLAPCTPIEAPVILTAWRTVALHSPAGLLVCDVGGETISINRQHAELFLPATNQRTTIVQPAPDPRWPEDARPELVDEFADSAREAARDGLTIAVRRIWNDRQLLSITQPVHGSTEHVVTVTLPVVGSDWRTQWRSEDVVLRESPLIYPGPVLGALTNREREILAFLAHDLSNKEIAARIYRSWKTVDNHLQRMTRRLDGWTRSDLSTFARSLGFRVEDIARRDVSPTPRSANHTQHTNHTDHAP